MENSKKLIDNILKNFLKTEAETTDKRIMSIRKFLSCLTSAIDKYIKEHMMQPNHEDIKRLISMFDDMAEIYREEISYLLVKRGKLAHYLEIFYKMDNLDILNKKDKNISFQPNSRSNTIN